MLKENHKRLSIDVPADLHARLKMFSAARKMNMKEYLIATMTRSMDRDEQKNHCPIGLSHEPNETTIKTLNETEKAIQKGTLKSYKNSDELFDYLNSNED